VKEPTEEEPVAQEGDDQGKVVKEPTEEEPVAQEGNDQVKVVKDPTEEEPVAQEGNGQGKVVKEPTEEGQEVQNGNQNGVTRVRGKQFHSMTRKDCSFQLIKTELEFEYIMDLSDLKWGTPTSRLETVTSEQVVELKKLYEDITTVQGRAALDIALAKYLGVSVTVTRTMTISEIKALITKLTITKSQHATIYSFPVTGKITVQEVVTRHDFWKWVGKDCGELGALPAEELVTKEFGEEKTYPINSTVIIVEYHASTVAVRGYDWAKGKAIEKIQHGAWVP
jgi:hypothetical protein